MPFAAWPLINNFVKFDFENADDYDIRILCIKVADHSPTSDQGTKRQKYFLVPMTDN